MVWSQRRVPRWARWVGTKLYWRGALFFCRVAAGAADSVAAYTGRTGEKRQRFRIKDGEKGPIVWEVKYARFYRKHGPKGLPGRAHTLMVARNVLQPDEIKYFLSNMVVGTGGVTLEGLLWVAFSRWPIERCFELGKRELGMDHFEVRSWDAIHRHFYISQLSQLFCARIHQDLREKNSRKPLSDRGTGSRRCLSLGYGSSFAQFGANDLLSTGRRVDCVLSAPQPTSPEISQKKHSWPVTKIGYKCQSIEVVYTA